jgi:flagellin-like hook-associated protein FlgL
VDRLNNAQTFLTQEQLQLTSAESATLSVDMSSAVTDLTQAETVQQALVQAGGKISQTNLFDYLPSS